MGLRTLSYGHTLMQQVKGHCLDSQASAITPLVLSAFIYPPRLLRGNFIYAPFFILTLSLERRTLCHLEWIVDDSVKKKKTPDRRLCYKVNKKREGMQRGRQTRGEKSRRTVEVIGMGSTEPGEKEGGRRNNLRWSGGTHAPLSFFFKLEAGEAFL